MNKTNWTVKSQGKRFAIYRNGVLVEGGFFSRQTAWEMMEQLSNEERRERKGEYDFQS